MEPLLNLAQRHLHGKEVYARACVRELLNEFLSIEESFKLGGSTGITTEQEAIDSMRKVGG